MFSSLGLFQSLPCPEKSTCKRPGCIFSHLPDVTHIPTVPVPVDIPSTPSTSKPVNVAAAATTATASTSYSQRVVGSASIPAKRPLSPPLRRAAGSNDSSSTLSAIEPPRKLQKTGLSKKPVATAVQPSVSFLSLVQRYVRNLKMLDGQDRCTRPSSQCCFVAGRDSRPSGIFESSIL